MGIILFCTLLSYIIPAGSYDMIPMGDSGKEIIDASTFQYVESTPVSLMQMLSAIPRGMEAAAQVIFLIFIVGGSFAVLTYTGAIEGGLGRLAKVASGKELLLIPIIICVFSLGSATAGLAEEMILFVPIMVGLARALGFDSLTGVAMALCGTAAGYAGAISTPFTVCVAQSIAGVPLLSGAWFRVIVFICMVTPIIVHVMHHASKVKKNPQLSPVYETDKDRAYSVDFDSLPPFGVRQKIILVLFIIALILEAVGVLQFGWYLNEISAVFLGVSILAAIIGKVGFNKYAEVFCKGMCDMAGGALLVGFASAVMIVLQDGNVLNTILHGVSGLLEGAPATVGALGMYVFQCLLNFLVPSGSGQAAIAMPIMAPLADLIGVTRQTAVLAFQIGDGISNSILPTSGIFIAALSMVGISWQKWAKWLLPAILVQYALGAGLIVVAQMIGYA